MYYVYLIRSIPYPEITYAGFSEDLRERLKTHNAGGSVFTADAKPWELIFYSAFKEKGKALEFEAYLKTHSGREFAKKRFW